MKKILFSFVLFFSSFSFSDIIKSYGVDGSSNNVNVVINDHSPIVFFECDDRYIISSFEIKISSTQQGLTSGNTVWYISDSTTTENTLNYITRVKIDNQKLKEGVTYYILITVYETNGSSETVNDTFYVSRSAITEFKTNITLEIDQNNPFCPSNGESTKIRYKVDKDIIVSIYIFSISGKYICTLKDKQVAFKDMIYTIDWDGKDNNGNVLPQGVYLVVLYSEGSNPVSKLVAIIDKR